MRLLLFSDLHCHASLAQDLVRRSAQADVLVGAGDFANSRQGLEICLEVLQQVSKPSVLVPGNNESFDELKCAAKDWKSAHVLHGSSVTIQGVSFFGIGGGIPVTPFGPWSFDFTEQEAAELLKTCPDGSVLVSHSPPKGTLDKDRKGQHFGSVSVCEAIKAKMPKLVVCGHIHHSGGQKAQLGKTTVINAGPNGMEWELK